MAWPQSSRPQHWRLQSASSTQENAQAIANWLIHELLREIKDTPIADLPFSGDAIGELVALIHEGAISNKIAKSVFAELLENGGSPRAIVEAKGLTQITRREDLEPIVAQVIAENGPQAEQYRGGNERMLGFFVGKVMGATGGRANPPAVNALIKELLDS